MSIIIFCCGAFVFAGLMIGMYITKDKQEKERFLSEYENTAHCPVYIKRCTEKYGCINCPNAKWIRKNN